MTDMNREIQYIKGVGEKRSHLFNRLGVYTVADLLRYFPRGYQDFSAPSPISETQVGDTACIKAMVAESARVSRIRRGMTLYKFRVADSSAVCEITFFNNKYITDLLTVGKTYYFYGRVGGSLYRREMTSPEFEGGDAPAGLRPVYPLTEGLTSRLVAAAVKQALVLCADIPDPLPDTLRQEYGLCHIGFALQGIHFPKDSAALETAKRRLVFEELLALSLGMSLLRGHDAAMSAPPCQKTDLEPFWGRLPFEPTNAQRRAAQDGAADMSRPVPMNRLIEGDVGSGKTAVAAALCFLAAQNGIQSALMAPTEILARQHLRTLTSLLSPLGLTVGLLTGSLAGGEKQRVCHMLKTHQLDVAVGTHALLSQGVDFDRLGLVITDEQHRFGVGQRADLASKGISPHVLVMSATPIPRTLALIIYGDLDISVLDEMPRGRRDIKTWTVDSSKRERVYNFIKQHIKEGHQAYVICPLVEQGEVTDASLADATGYAEKIAKEDFAGYKVGLLHGRLKPAEKDAVMRDFSQGRLDVLVSTTVVEVGVDVPNATVMVIENAERFGLSQLHQLRGRVGRGDVQSHCILISDARGHEAAERISTMRATADGFKIAEKDLALRGPGDFFGSRQHGLPELKIADFFTDMAVLKEARRAAESLLNNDPCLKKHENTDLKAMVEDMFSKDGVIFN